MQLFFLKERGTQTFSAVNRYFAKNRQNPGRHHPQVWRLLFLSSLYIVLIADYFPFWLLVLWDKVTFDYWFLLVPLRYWNSKLFHGAPFHAWQRLAETRYANKVFGGPVLLHLTVYWNDWHFLWKCSLPFHLLLCTHRPVLNLINILKGRCRAQWFIFSHLAFSEFFLPSSSFSWRFLGEPCDGKKGRRRR